MEAVDQILAAVTVPLEVALADGTTVSVTRLEAWNGLLRAQVRLTRDGVELPFDNPWLVANPPCCVRVEGEAVPDPAGALTEMIRTSGHFHG